MTENLTQALLGLLVVLAIFGIVWWAFQQIPLPPPLRIAAVVAVAIIAVLILLKWVAPALGVAL